MPDAKKVDLQDTPALEHYAKWRPRLKRGATWAGTAAFLSKTVNPTAKWPALVIPILAAGVAGAGDAALEEKLRAQKNTKARHLVERGFEEKHMASKKASVEDDSLFPDAAVEAAERQTNAALVGLARKKGELTECAAQQLGDCFPRAGADEASYGRGLRVTTGHGSIARILDRVYR